MSEPIKLPHPEPILDGNINPEFDGCLIIKRCNPEAVDQIMADFDSVSITCVPGDAITVDIHTLTEGSFLEGEL